MNDGIERLPRVLVVEDEAALRDVLSNALEFAGYEVTTAANGLLALSELGVRLPDVILLDLAMPVMDGFTFRARQLRSPHLAPIPVIVVSAEQDVRGKAVALSAHAWLTKPFDLDDLLDTVAEACAA